MIGWYGFKRAKRQAQMCIEQARILRMNARALDKEVQA